MIRPRNSNVTSCLAVLGTLFATNTAVAGALVNMQNPVTVTDWSGMFTVAITWNDSPDKSERAIATGDMMAPGPGYMLIGGGGAVVDAQGNPGALMLGSGPPTDLNCTDHVDTSYHYCSSNASWPYWLAYSHDATYVYFHKVRVYSIWLKVAGLSSSELNRYLIYAGYNSDDAVFGHQEKFTPTLPSNYTLIGGGGGVATAGCNYLVASEPDLATNRWHIMTKDHGTSSRSTISYLAVGIDLNALKANLGIDAEVIEPPMVGTIPLGGTWPSGYILTTRWWDTTSSTRSAITAIGGRAYYKGTGRLINNLGFTSDASHKLGVTVYTKDHQYSDSGFNTLSWIGIRRRTTSPPIIMY